MIIKCGWCGKNLGEKEPLDNKRITHGVCPECEGLFKELIDQMPQTDEDKGAEQK